MAVVHKQVPNSNIPGPSMPKNVSGASSAPKVVSDAFSKKMSTLGACACENPLENNPSLRVPCASPSPNVLPMDNLRRIYLHNLKPIVTTLANTAELLQLLARVSDPLQSEQDKVIADNANVLANLGLVFLRTFSLYSRLNDPVNKQSLENTLSTILLHSNNLVAVDSTLSALLDRVEADEHERFRLTNTLENIRYIHVASSSLKASFEQYHLTFPNASSDEYHVDLQAFYLSDDLPIILEPLRLVAEREGKRILLDSDPGLLVTADAVLIQFVIEVLVSNALKYTPEEVRVSLRRMGDFVQIVVEDDGDGMTPAEAKHAFDKLVTNPNHKPDSSGIGLFYAKDIVEAIHGGSLFISSRRGPTRFTLQMPLLGVESVEPLEPEEPLQDD